MASMGGGRKEYDDLMSAEAQASQLVSEARSARSERLKEAKKEAEGLINSYRAEKEASYQATMQSTLGSSGDEKATLKRETDAAVSKMAADFAANKKAAVDMLVKEVTRVVNIVPEGLKKRQQ